MRTKDDCQVCGVGVMLTYVTKTNGLSRVRYLRCNKCKAKAKESLLVDDRGREIILPLVIRPNNLTPSTGSPTNG
jgi:hypothetical protein